MSFASKNYELVLLTAFLLFYIFRNISYIFANRSLYKMTQCLQKMEHFSAISLKNVSFAAVIE